jgi:hypothetical protein
MALYVGLDVSLKTTAVWEGKAESEPVPLVEALTRWRAKIALVGIEACPLSEWLYGALVESEFHTVCIETRHAQRFLSSRPNKTDRSDAHGIADMMRLGHCCAIAFGSAGCSAFLFRRASRSDRGSRSRAADCLYSIFRSLRPSLKKVRPADLRAASTKSVQHVTGLVRAMTNAI